MDLWVKFFFLVVLHMWWCVANNDNIIRVKLEMYNLLQWCMVQSHIVVRIEGKGNKMYILQVHRQFVHHIQATI